MKLKSIKLAGFKTFVDPTRVPLQSNLVAVVGPNGCGKSNIIDAIRWVMGESSAKQLRGEAVTDVIFNGSLNRKPVGQASIELIFDNSEGRLGGEYAKYAEIAIRRQVTRDGQSNYFLNGARCRRRDIVDIFLGTGLGPRSYAIIEQGTISRLIEAKPEDLRTHIEEAAGISKYKERRRETELRMQHTRDNLQRLADVRDEVGKQLERLEKQAKTAEQYKTLKAQERLLKAKLLGRRWETLTEELTTQEKLIQTQELTIEAEQTKLSQQEKQIIELQELHHSCAEQVSMVEKDNYSKKADISRLEQMLLHQQQRIQHLQADNQQASRSLATLQSHQQEDQQLIELLASQITELTPQFEQTQAITIELQEKLTEAEHLQQHWQSQWDKHLTEVAKYTQDAQVQQTKIQHIERTWQNNEQRIARLREELANLDDSTLLQQLTELTQQREAQQQQEQQLAEQLGLIQNQLIELRAQYQLKTRELLTHQQQLQKLAAQQTSLQTLQEEALGKKHNKIQQWLTDNQLANAPRLAEKIEVEAGWEKAVEIVLNQRLQAIGVEDLESLTSLLNQVEQGSVTLLQLNNQAKVINNNLLASKIKSSWPVASLLAGIYYAESLAEAWQQRETLAEHESIITADGVWLGKSWTHLHRVTEVTTGLIARERELHKVTADIAIVKTQVAQQEQLIEDLQNRLHELEQQREQVQQQLNDSKNQTAQTNAQLQIKQAKLQQLQQRSQELERDITELQQQQEHIQAELQATRKLWQTALENMEQYQQQQAHLKAAKENANDNYRATNQQVQSNREQTQQLNSRLNTLKAQLEAKQQHLQRVHTQFQEQQQRCELLQQQQLEAELPIAALQQELQLTCEAQLQVEQQLANARDKLQAIDNQIKSIEKAKLAIEQEQQQIRAKLEGLRINKQAILVRRDTLVEQLTEGNYQLLEIQQLLSDEDSANFLETELEQLSKRIQRLGAINLAAIEEYQVESERKHYLDSQHNDLIGALNTLEDAIRKIDQETRSRFKETFELVNQGLQNLFPKLFGGGQAYLELTEDDLLTAGVNIMARPPGKRNSTIHLLSGGEKALTAVALVFAIFQLNPAPFCLLDEVDAPLDDANVSRYSNLLKTMADKVQFIFITHNKVAMEAAEQLIGVTMREPGVSKLVAVDIAEAMEMAEI